MAGQELEGHNAYGSHTYYRSQSLTVRDIVAIAFRRRWLITVSFLGILGGAIAAAAFQPSRYESSMTILVKRDRVDSVVTPTTSVPPATAEITEEELNSEVELLKSRDLLEQIVLRCNLQDEKHKSGASRIGDDPLLNSWTGVGNRRVRPAGLNSSRASLSNAAAQTVSKVEREAAQPSWLATAAATGVPNTNRDPKKAEQVARAVLVLDKALKISVLKKTNMIAASYQSEDPQLAERVLSTLADLYLEKHVSVHRLSGAFDFFQQEAQKYRVELTEAEARLVEFNRKANVVSASVEKDIAIQKLADFEVILRQTEAAIAETQQRIGVLEQQITLIPTRMTTQVRNADDGMLVSQLKANLLVLEQKRAELLAKFEPSYRPVQEIGAQIALARNALAEKSQLHEETTDRDPTYEWTRSEVAKAKADLAGLQSRAERTAATVEWYQQNARALEQKGIVQGDLVRVIKAAEENLLLSLQKEEEARISDALDRGRILNVAIAAPPSVPSLPSTHRSRVVLFGGVFALLTSIGLAFASERLDSTFRTPDEVITILDLAVLAAIPQGGLLAHNSEVGPIS
jgi:uncharacterized protein involved in exopolysaccharide biosynthesis